MKFITFKSILITLLAISCTLSNEFTAHHKSKNKVRTTDWVRPLINTAKSYISFANLPYCPGSTINDLACPLCSTIVDASFKVFSQYKNENGFTYVILFSKNRNEVVITFSGPPNLDPSYYSHIYRDGFVDINCKTPGLSVEKSFHTVYYGSLQAKLKADLLKYKKLFKAKDSDHQYVFVGHNFGGSLAVVAAHDLLDHKIITANKDLNSPIAYTYGALRVGNSKFVDSVNNKFKVVRINKKEDAYTRMAVCDWSPSVNSYRCEGESQDPRLNEKSNRPKLYSYLQHYYGPNNNFPTLNIAYGSGHPSFLEKSSKSNIKNKKRRDDKFLYAQVNPGKIRSAYLSEFTQEGYDANLDSISYSAPLGAEVLFSNDFNNQQICTYFNNIPSCESRLPQSFEPSVADNYFSNKINSC